MSSNDQLGVAVIGAGYWGPNLIRNFRGSEAWDLRAVCDLDVDRAHQVLGARSGVDVTDSLADVLCRDDVDAVAIATPARTHRAIATAALEAGKHVLVEKPLADDVSHGREMVRMARDAGLVLMADHTYCYTPAVLKIRELVESGELGEILFVDSVRINLGLIQPDVDVFWDLAPHDLSILDFVLPGGLRPTGVAAQGADPLGAGRACVGYLTLPLEGGAMAHVHVNWLSPTKIRQMVVAGTKRTLVWDDLNPQQRVSVYDRASTCRSSPPTGSTRGTPGSPTAWATPGPRPCPSARPWARWSPSSRPRSPRAARPARTARPDCGCSGARGGCPQHGLRGPSSPPRATSSTRPTRTTSTTPS